jgi:hypothetical protein
MPSSSRGAGNIAVSLPAQAQAGVQLSRKPISVAAYWIVRFRGTMTAEFAAKALELTQ